MNLYNRTPRPLVSISCITYNHASYIRQCLDGFLMQETSFTFEVLIHDDCSTDGTTNIIKEYEKKYPNIIKPLYETENQYQHGKPSGSLVWNFPRAKGRYIALCEGDDYWIDPLKLQKQVDFLESYPEYSMCFHNAKTLMLDGSINKHRFAIDHTREYSQNEILKKWTIPTASALFRSVIISDKRLCHPGYKFGDNVLFLTASMYGKIYGFNEYWSVYRSHPGGMTNKNGNVKWMETIIEHTKVLDTVFGDYLAPNLCKDLNSASYIYLIRRNRNSLTKIIKYFILGFRDCDVRFLKTSINTWVLRKKI